jgi:hypothetical protein
MQTPALREPTNAQRHAMGFIVAPYVHACCPGGCSCIGRLARYIPGTGFDTFIPSRPFSASELRAQARRYDGPVVR